MKVYMKCFADLSKRYTCDYNEKAELEVLEGTTVKEAIHTLGVPEDDVKLMFVNGKIADVSSILKHGDQVALAPATGGM